MRKNVLKNKVYLTIVVVLSICLTLISSITTFATTDNDNTMIQKQKEVDEYLFEEHTKEIEDKGFTVTHTAPLEDYVEIGITPYNKENADYLYEILGSDNIKVVEGQQATLMNEGTSNEKNTFVKNSLIYGIVVVAAIGTIVFVTNKKKTAK